MNLPLVAGWTAPVALFVKEDGELLDLTGLTLEAVLYDATGATVSNPGTVMADADQATNKGKCLFTPASSGVFVVANGPYTFRIKITQSGKVSYAPSGTGLVVEIRK
jgi:hypothetical protein